MHYSKQREVLMAILHNTTSHPTANDIYEKMREKDPKISRGTVYRNLALLTENGMVKRIDTEHSSVHYDGTVSRHYHFVCNECGAVCDLSIPDVDFNGTVEKELGCSVSDHSLVFYGKCKNCI